MTGARLNATLDDKAFMAGVARLGGVLHVGVLSAIGTAMVEETQKRFETGRDVWGVAWAPLSPAYAQIKRGPGILRASRMLQRSITFQVSGASVTVGSNRVYAGVHQFGAVITPKNAPALTFLLGAGAGMKSRYMLVHAQSVRIPQRPYLGFGPNDQRAVMDVLDVFVQRSLRA